LAAPFTEKLVFHTDLGGLHLQWLSWPHEEQNLHDDKRFEGIQIALRDSVKRKGDSHLLCGAPFGPFRQKVAVTFSPDIIYCHLVPNGVGIISNKE
jgi:hypothetical protein